MHQTLRLAVILGSVRPGRKAEAVGRWVHRHASRREGITVELVDLVEHRLPVLDEPLPAAYGRYERPHTMAWSETIASYDGYIVVTPEYNRSIPGPLKNAIDYLYQEWHDKAAGFVSYGIDAAGTRAVEHLRVVMGELRVADVRAQVAMSLATDFDGETFTPAPRRDDELDVLLDQLIAWSGALRTVRRGREVR
ncbi:NADPH-dependent FMN reductase [Micromonospora humi]|uniref:NAD(P)H-dependent FMN reductase n=1 Tax=Micromonospora humi TaxID=745366 RepID=A0A1C5IGI3_9ACTN|nr:NAD(P)H-dependent oxidoreductase [Micromonospora humi]SCG57497.1 NAD(P)H-dependent FMN reductase [Micromonospora humi]